MGGIKHAESNSGIIFVVGDLLPCYFGNAMSKILLYSTELQDSNFI